MDKLVVKGAEISVQWNSEQDDFISLTDIAKLKDSDNPRYIIQNWLRNRNTIEFLGVWESLYNPSFNRVEFDAFRSQAGLNSFVMTPQKWVESTGAIGIISKAGRYGGTYAHKEIAFEFASWISVEFKLYLVKEFERLKTEEMKQLGWDIKRNLVKINYRIHTDAIKENLIPPELSAKQVSMVYASEADVLNMALFGMTAKQWRDSHPNLKGNIRDYANVSQLVCLSNLENLNAVFISEGMSQAERLERGSTFGTDFLDCPKSRPLFYPQSLAIQGFCRDKLSVRIWTLKSKQLKMTAEAAENPEFEPLFPETELLLCPKKCVLILLWRFKVQSGMWAFLIIESDVFVNLLSQFSLRAVSTAVKLLLLKHGKERFHHGVVVRRSCLGKRLRDL